MPLGQLILPQLANNFPTFSGTRHFIILCTKPVIRPYPKSMKTTNSQLKVHFNIILPFLYISLTLHLHIHKNFLRNYYCYVSAKVASNLQGKCIRISVTDLTRKPSECSGNFNLLRKFPGKKNSTASKLCSVRERGNKYEYQSSKYIS